MKFLALMTLALTACAGPAVVTPQPYAVPVQTRCDPPAITEPNWNVDDLHPGVGIFDGVQAIVADEPLHSAYEAELRAAIDACRSIAVND